MTGKQDLVSVTIDPGVVDPDDVEMLQDLVLAAVSDALNQAKAHGGGQARPGHRRTEDPGAVIAGPGTSHARDDRSSSRSSVSSSRSRGCPGIGPKTAQRLTYHLLRAPDTEARIARGGPHRGP